MPAAVVETFRLPHRKLPAPCFDPGTFIALADGPSTQEYDFQELRNSSAKILCYGRVAGSIQPDYYTLADPGFADVLFHLPATRVLISRDGPYGGPDAKSFWDQLPQDQGHGYDWAPECCAHHPVLNALHLGAQRVFLLGRDGYLGNDGVLKAASHAEHLIDTTFISKQRYAAESPEKYANQAMTDVNRVCWDLVIRATHRLEGKTPEIYNLSFASRHRPVWDVHPQVLAQPFGRIDRRGPAVVVHILQADAQLPELDQDCSIPRAKWGPLHLENHADFINRLRSIQPHLAIYVRTHALVQELAERLADDIQVGGLQTQLDPWLHGQVSHFRLPSINDC